MAAVGEQRITYDARGLAEPNAEAPRTAKVRWVLNSTSMRVLPVRFISRRHSAM